MSTEAAQLDLLTPPRPAVDVEDLRALYNELKGRGWLTAAELLETRSAGLRGWPQSEAGKRRVRAIADASRGHVISGQRGYRLTEEATLEEVRHAATWLRHQAGEMTGRAMEIDRVLHRRAHPWFL